MALHKNCISKHVRIKFKDSIAEFEGVISFYNKEGSRGLTRLPTSQYSFVLDDADKTEIVFEFYAVDTIAYL